MSFANWRLLMRRWYVVVAGLLFTVLLCAAAIKVVPVKYETNSAILLLPPKSSVIQDGGNPFLALGGLDVAAGVVARAMSDRTSQQAVAKAGATGTYTIAPDAVSGGPVLLITGDAITPAEAQKTVDVVSQLLPKELESVQDNAGISSPSQIQSRLLTRDGVALPVRKPLIRALLVAILAGLALTLLAASLVDGLMLRRVTGRRLSGTYQRTNGVGARAGIDRADGVNGLGAHVPNGQRVDGPVDPAAAASIDGPTTRLRARFDPVTRRVTDRA